MGRATADLDAAMARAQAAVDLCLAPAKGLPYVLPPAEARCEALETAGGVLIGLGSCLALLAIGAFWCLVFVAVARVALG